MRMRLNLQIYKEIKQGLDFMKDKPDDFVAMLAPKLLKRSFEKDKIIFKEGETVHSIYFLLKGEAVFCLSKGQET